MKPTYIGFQTQPYAVIIWDGKYKTICYSKLELDEALARYRIPGDFYYQMPHNVHYFFKKAIPA